jgi:flagellar biosynthesis protein FlhF
MLVKKFEAPTMQDALKVVKQEMGPEAIILSTRNNRKAFGLLSKPSVEVTAAVSNKGFAQRSLDKKLQEKESPLINRDQIANAYRTRNNPIANARRAYEASRNILEEDKFLNEREKLRDQQMNMQQREAEEQRKRKQLGFTKTPYHMIQDDNAPIDFTRNLNTPAAVTSISKNRIQKQAPAPAPRVQAAPEQVKSEPVIAQQSGVDESITTDLVQSIFAETGENPAAGPATEKLVELMMQQIKVEDPYDSPAKYQMFVGPTGVGKTTTIAKIASQLSIDHGKKVALITTDTYRIGAIEQLSIYASILELPVFVANSVDELKEKIEETQEFDHILIDTSGHNPHEDKHILYLRQAQSEIPDMNINLLLSATTRESDTYDIINNYAICNIDNLIFTKIDESKSHGIIFNCAVRYPYPCTFFTNGQRVPEDIEASSKERVIDLVFEISRREQVQAA